MMRQQLILVDEMDRPLGEMEKMEVHRKGLLHRAFSIFIFNKKGEMLLQQRADGKYHSPGLWTNACCSHPSPGEDTRQAAARRLQEELGFTTELEELFAFTYRVEFENGLTEHEYDHVFAGIYEGTVHANNNEVKGHGYWSLRELSTMVNQLPERYTSWFRIALPEVIAFRDAAASGNHISFLGGRVTAASNEIL